MTAAEPPIRGDHRATWWGIAVIAVLFAAAVTCAALIASAMTAP